MLFTVGCENHFRGQQKQCFSSWLAPQYSGIQFTTYTTFLVNWMNHVTRQAGRMFRYLNTLHILYKISLLYVLLSVNFMKIGSSDFSCWQLLSLSRNFSFLMQPEVSIPYQESLVYQQLIHSVVCLTTGP
jgi:hypothetical protein